MNPYKMTKKQAMILEHLKQGGYFREELERNKYLSRDKFVTRFYTCERRVVKGVGFQAKLEFENFGLLRRKECVVYSTWPSELQLREFNNVIVIA